MGKIMNSLDLRVQELQQQIFSLQGQIRIIEHKQKSAKGIGKDRQFYLLEIKNKPDENLLFYFMYGRFIAINSCHEDVYSNYVVDLIDTMERFDCAEFGYKVRRIKKEEALQYL